MIKNNLISEKIISKALELFFKKGFNSVTMDDLSTELAMSKKTFYKIFPSKKEIARMAILTNLKLVEKKISKVIDSDEPLLIKMSIVLKMAGENISRIKNENFRDIKKYIPELWEEIEKFRKEKLLSKIEKLLYEAKENNYLRSNINIDVLIMIFESSIHGIINPDILSEKSFSAQQALQTIVATIFEGAMTEEASKKFNEINKLQN